MHVRFLAAGLVLALAVPASAQQRDPQQPAPARGRRPRRPVSFEEQVVVSASRTEQQLVNAPAAVSLITTETIQNSPATNIGDLLRAVPGVNVAQMSARDINLTTRGATSTLATSQLALVDGRSVYLDFFGMVMWDLVPTNPNDIRQIEVIRGPGVGGVGRERDDRRRQRHHEDPARAGGAAPERADNWPRHLRS